MTVEDRLFNIVVAELCWSVSFQVVLLIEIVSLATDIEMNSVMRSELAFISIGSLLLLIITISLKIYSKIKSYRLEFAKTILALSID